MKYYSEFTKIYVQDICDALASANIVNGSSRKHFSVDDFETLTEFIKDLVIKPMDIHGFLNQRNLVNRGRCPFTGEPTSSSSPTWTWHNHRSILLSSRGFSLMQKEEDEEYERVMGSPPPNRNQKSGCYIATVCYGSEYAPEVILLKKYRDIVLSKSVFGRVFISTYYFISPSIARLLNDRPFVNKLIRKNILDVIIKRIH